MGTLIDTSVLIGTERGGAAPVLPDGELVGIAAITASELLHGVHRAATPAQRARRESFVVGVLRALPVLPFDLDVARVHARVWAELAAAGRTPPPHDLIVAATALSRGWQVLTGDPGGFEAVPGLKVRRG